MHLTFKIPPYKFMYKIVSENEAKNHLENITCFHYNDMKKEKEKKEY